MGKKEKRRERIEIGNKPREEGWARGKSGRSVLDPSLSRTPSVLTILRTRMNWAALDPPMGRFDEHGNADLPEGTASCVVQLKVSS